MTPYYEDALVTIYHGDSREVMRGLGLFDVVAADPPYAFGAKRGEWRITASVAIALAEAAHHVTPKGCMAVMTAASGRGIEYALGAVGEALPLNRLLVWHKRFVNSAVAGPWRWDIVPILLFGKASFGRPSESSCYISDGHSRLDSGHPAELPEGLGRWLIEPFVDAKTVLDPFCGSGVFVVAAKRAGKRVVGIDREERYCEMTVNRCRQEVMELVS